MRLPPAPTFDLPLGAWEVVETDRGFAIVDPDIGGRPLEELILPLVSPQDFAALIAALHTASPKAQWVPLAAGLAIVQVFEGAQHLQLLPAAVAGGLVLDAIVDPACIIDSDNQILAVNRPWRFVDPVAETPSGGVGASYTQVLTRGIAEGADGAKTFADALARLRGEEAREEEAVSYQMPHPDGTLHSFLARLRRWPAAGAQAVLVVHTDITRVVIAAQAHDDHAVLVRQAGDLAKIGGWILDLEHHHLEWTVAVCRMHGMPDDYVPTLEAAIQFYASDAERERIARLVEHAIATGDGWSTDLRIRTAQGEIRWLRSIGEAEWRDGRVVKLRGAVQDVTDAKQQIQELEDAQARLGIATRGAQIGLWEWDGLGPTSPVVADAVVCTVLGQPTPGPTTMAALLEAIHADDRAHVWTQLRDLAATHLPFHALEVRFWRASGHGGWVRLRAEWSLRPDGTGRILGTFWDISGQRQAELQRQDALKQLALAARGAKMAVFELPPDRDDFVAGDGYLAHMLGLPDPPGWSWTSAVLERVLDSDRGRLEQAVHDLRVHRQPLDVTVAMQPVREHGVRYLRFMAQVQPTGTGGAASILGLVHDVTKQRASEEELAYLADHDQLTGLRNRHGLLRLLQDLVTTGAQDGVLCMLLDVDGFTQINEAHGYATGDQVLRGIADRLRLLTPTGGEWARVAGDEFVLVAPWRLSDGSPTDPEKLASACKHAVEAPLVLEALPGTPLRISVTIGLAVTAIEDHPSAEHVLQQADVAMAEARTQDETHIGLIEPPVAARHRAEAVLLQELRMALATTQSPFVIHYQPQLSLRTQRIIGVEALVRWPHPTRGLLGPDQFLPLGERHGLYPAVGQAVLQQALTDAAQWWREGYAVPVAVNLSPLQFDRADIVTWVHGAVQASGLPHAALELELTESAFARQPEAVIERLRALRAAGVRIALDDFGTGYSSLALLNQLPLDRLKIDRAFIHHLAQRGRADGRTISRLILSLARDLELETVAEGVEQPDDLLWLREHGCDVVQGYLVSRPLVRPDLVAFFQQHCIQSRAEWEAAHGAETAAAQLVVKS